MEPSFAKLLGLLARGGIACVIVGGVAVTLHGYVRLTEDVDLLVQSGGSNVLRLFEVLKNFGEGFAGELSLADFDDSEGAIRIVEETEGCSVDLFTRIMALRYEDVIGDAETFLLEGMELRYASKRALIAWKESSQREKARLDALALKKLQADSGAFD